MHIVITAAVAMACVIASAWCVINYREKVAERAAWTVAYFATLAAQCLATSLLVYFVKDTGTQLGSPIAAILGFVSIIVSILGLVFTLTLAYKAVRAQSARPVPVRRS